MPDQPWHRLPQEPRRAYAAFCRYYQMAAHERSIEAVWTIFAEADQALRGRPVPRHWWTWSSKWQWVARAGSYDEYLAEEDRLLWERRRAELRQRDWDQADDLRNLVAAALPHAEQFIHSQRRLIRGAPDQVDADGNVVVPGTPDREIVTVSFDITGLARVLEQASKLQRLATDEPTENINNLSGAALDAAIAKALAILADGGEARGAETLTGDAGGEAGEADADGRAG